MKTLLPILKTKLFILSFISACTVILATTVPQIKNFIAPEKAIGEKIVTEQKKIAPKIKQVNKTVNALRATSNLSLGTNNLLDATLISDAVDYQPGSTCTLTGAGFEPGETVTVQVLHADYQIGDPIGDEHQPWDVVVDASGNFTTTWYVCEDDCVGELLRATATAQTSAQIVWTEFTDAAITSTGTGGDWNQTTTWVGGVVPGAGDDVTIAAGATVTVTDNRSAQSVVIAASGSTNTSLIINSGVTLSVSGNVTINAPGTNNRTNELSVGAGTLNITAGNLSVNNGGGSNRKGILSISTGTTSVSGNVTVANNSDAQINFSGSGLLQIGGSFTFGNSSTITVGTGTIEYSGAAQTISGSLTYYNLTTSGSGTKTLTTGIVVSNSFTIGSGTIVDAQGFTTTISGGASLNVNGTLDFTSANGEFRSGTSGTSTLVMGANGLIKTNDGNGVGPSASVDASLQTQGGGAWSTNISTSGTVEYYRNNTGDITDQDYNNLVITNANAKTWTIAATRTVNGNLTINSSAPFTLSGTQTINLKGNWSNSGTFTAGSSTIEINGTGSQTISASPFNNFTVNKSSGTATLTGNVSVAGNLRVNSGILDLSTFTANGAGGFGQIFQVQTGGILKVGGTSNFPTGYPNQLFNAGSLVDFNADADQTIPNPGVSYGNLTLSGATTARTKNASGTLTLRGTFTNNNFISFNGAVTFNTDGGITTTDGGVNGSTTTFTNLTINTTSPVIVSGGATVTGTLSLQANTLNNSSGNITMANGSSISRDVGTLSAAPTFSTSVNVSYTGSTAVTTGNELPVSSTVLNNLTINKSGGVSLGANAAVNGTLSLTSGTFSIGANTLTINGAISVTGGSLSGGSTSNIVFGGSGAGTMLPAITLNDLTLNRANGILLGGNVTVGGILGLTNGALSIGSNTLTLNGTSSITGGSLTGGSSSNIFIGGSSIDLQLPAVTLNNLTVEKSSGAATLVGNVSIGGNLRVNSNTLDLGTFTANGSGGFGQIFQVQTGGILKVGGTSNFPTGYPNQLFNAGSLVDFNADADQTISNPGVSYGNLTLSGATTARTKNASGVLTLRGTFTNNNFINFNGAVTFSTDGGITTTDGGVNGSTTTFTNLTINTTSPVIVSGGATVTVTLALTNGILTTGSSNLTIGSGGTFTGGSATSHVNGKLARVYNATGSKTFPIGKGGNYRPLSLDYTALTGTSTVTAEQMESTIPGTNPAGYTVQSGRHWVITESGGSSFTYDITLNGDPFTPGANDPFILKGDGVTNTSYAATFSSPNFTATGLNAFSNFAVASACPDPTISDQPDDVENECVGSSAVFNVTASGPGSITYQWYKENGGTDIALNDEDDGGDIQITNSGATLTINNLVAGDAGDYYVIVTRACGSSATSDPATLTLDVTAPTITAGGTTTTLGCNPSASDINDALGTATATDAVSTPTVTSSDGAVQSTDCSRSQTRTFTAKDACNNTSTTSRTVTWTDDLTPPDFTSDFTTVPLGCNPASSDITAALGTATATDACGPATVTSSDGSVSGTCYKSQTRTFTAEDGCGNTATASRTVTWTDDTDAPEFTSSFTTVPLGCNPDASDITAALGTATATDGCGDATVTSSDGSVSGTCYKSQTRTFTAEDGCGNTATASRTVTWTDDTDAPEFTSSFTTVPLGCNPDASDITAALGTATATDGCGDATVTSSDGSVSGTCYKSQTRTFTAEDGCGNTATASRTVTWTDDTDAPEFTSSFTTVPLGCNPDASDITAALGTATATDGCGDATVTSSDGSVSGTCYKSQTRTFTAEDGCGNTATASRTVTWTDDTDAPEFTSSFTTVPLGCNPDASDITAALGTATATDGCGDATVTSSDGSVSGTCYKSQTRTFTAEDGCGNTATASRTVTWTDDTDAPEFTSSFTTVPLGCNPDASDITAALGTATATDGCGDATVTSSDGSVSGTCYKSQTRTFTAEDGCGNTATASRTVTWTDDTDAPEFTSSFTTVPLGCNPDASDITAALGTATATDGCGDATVTSSDGSVSGTCYKSQTRTFTAEDGCGNTATASRTVTWTDDTDAPEFTSSFTTVPLGCNPDASDITAALGTATATDGCGDATVTSSDGSVSGTCYKSQTRTFTAEDGCGNTATASRTVTWTDDTDAPEFTSSFTTVPLGCNPDASDITAALGTATATDGCGDATVTSSDGSVSGTCYKSQTRTFTAEDGCGNTATASRTVTWTDDTDAPEFTSSFTTVPLGCNPDASDITAALGTATATDGCGDATVTSSDGSVSGTCYKSQTRTFTAEDGCGNTATASRTVTWTDDTDAPEFTSSFTTVPLGCNPDASDITAALGTATATDGCGDATVTSSDGSVSGTCYKSQTRTFTAEDGCGNTATASRTVTWTDDTDAPEFTSSFTTVPLGCNPDASDITAALGTATATDGCGDATVTSSDGSVSGTCYKSQTRTFTAEDGCGNTATASRTVTWTDDTDAPEFTSSFTTVPLGCNPDASDITAALGTATATDGCGDATVTSSDGSVSGTCYKSQTRTFTAEDGCGNTATASRTVTWTDDTDAPEFTSSFTTVPLGCNPDASDITAALGTATATDGCGDATVTSSDGSVSGTCYKSQTRTFTAEDGCGNTATASRTVNWTYDVTPPTASNVTSNYKCVEDVPAPNTAVIIDETDNCGGTPTVTYLSSATTNNGGAGCPGDAYILTRYYKISDGCYNTSTASHTITVIDDVAPTASCKSISVTLGTGGSVTIDADDVDNGSNDNCDPSVGLTLDDYTFTDADMGTACSANFTVVLTATDDCGNTGTCTATVTVNKRATSLDYTGDNTEQYSDSTELKAVLTDVLTGNPVSGKTISFVIGTQSTSAVTNALGVAYIKMKMYQNVGDYDVTATFAGDATYCGTSVNEDYDILKENALTEYTGPEIVGDACTSCATTNVLLSASVKDTTDGMPGDIRKARVKFYIIGGADCSGWLTPGLVNPADTTEGIVTFNWIAPLPASGYTSYDIGVKVDCTPAGVGNYIGYTQGVVTIYRLSLNEFITGGGHIIPTASNGSYASTPGKKVNFGFNVKYNKSNKNLQGNMNIIFRRNNRVYQIKSNSMQSLSIVSTDPCSKKATFVSKANLNDVTDPNVPPVNIMGNLTLTAKMTDNGEPGNNDKIGITVYSGNTLIYSSNWVSTQTVEMVLNGGNIVVHNGVNCPNNTKIDNTITTKNAQMEVSPKVLPFNVKVFPNPTEHQFTLYLENGTNEKVDIVVYDAIGRQVKKIEKGDVMGAIKFGEDLKVGMYIVEVRQGENRKTLKLVKQ